MQLEQAQTFAQVGGGGLAAIERQQGFAQAAERARVLAVVGVRGGQQKFAGALASGHRVGVATELKQGVAATFVQVVQILMLVSPGFLGGTARP